jgi:hypothetical protein
VNLRRSLGRIGGRTGFQAGTGLAHGVVQLFLEQGTRRQGGQIRGDADAAAIELEQLNVMQDRLATENRS